MLDQYSESLFQANISPSDQIFEKQGDRLIYFKGGQRMEPNKFSSDHIKNYFLTITSETLSYEDCLKTKLQDKFDKSDQIFEQAEE